MKKLILSILDYFFPKYWYSYKSYSQDGEDMVLKAFYETKKGYTGFYVDIGAHHPYRFSNTAYFYRKGWRGLNIEPTPSLMNAFFRHRKKDINLNIGISDTKSSLTFFEFNEPALNSFDKELSLSRVSDKYKIISESEIKVFTLSEVLSKHLKEGQTIDFMNIDAEGLDLRILNSNDWGKFSPNYILVEGNFSADSLSSDEIYCFLKTKNYQLVARTKRTFIFELI
jgi:FkbM family methyltransferase